MKTTRILAITSVAVLLASRVFAAEAPAAEAKDPWRTDFDASLATAGEQGRAVLLDFTGSDWCVWCHRLDNEVFSKQAFLDYARDNLVLVKLDFPEKIKLPAELEAQNHGLSDKYGVTGYPTIVIVDAKGTEIGRLGYMEGGAKTFVRAVKKAIADSKNTIAKSS